MAVILVSGMINIETTVRVERFPIPYTPLRYPFFGVNNTVSGVGYNIARTLTHLGDEVRLLSVIGRDPLAGLVRSALERDRISGLNVLDLVAETAQSVILCDGEGRRQINADLKDVQETVYPTPLYTKAAAGCDLLVLSNANFSRPFLDHARKAGRMIATDVHAISDLNDPYNADFMRAADVLFISGEWLPVEPEEWARRVWNRYRAEVLVISLGGEGVLLAQKKQQSIVRIPAVPVRKAGNTIEGGDALFSAFVHYYAKTCDAKLALHKSMVFASYAIGEAPAANTLLNEAELDNMYDEMGGSW